MSPIKSIDPFGAKPQSLGLQKLEVDKLQPKKSTKGDWLSKANVTKGLSMSGSAFDMVGSIAKPLDHVSGANNIIGAVGNIAENIPGPIGQGISTGLKAIKLIDQLTGKKSNSQITTGETATGYNLDFNVNAGTSYGGLFGNKKRKQANTLSARQDTENIKKIGVSRSSQEQMLGASNSIQDIASKTNQQLLGGQNYRALAAKKGTKLSFKNIKKKVTKKMQQGGKMNVIPSGALHARKHNLPDEIAEGLTKKGIPVVSYDEGGKTTQHCEIEREEIILNLDLTKQLEKLKKEFDDGDENAALIAGQLLTKEILENTIDNTQILK